jgi:hypothetical protein
MFDKRYFSDFPEMEQKKTDAKLVDNRLECLMSKAE